MEDRKICKKEEWKRKNVKERKFKCNIEKWKKKTLKDRKMGKKEEKNMEDRKMVGEEEIIFPLDTTFW